MAFKDGDFLEVEYSAWSTADNALISTTDEKKAKEAEIYNKELVYGPVLVILGSNGVIAGLDRALHQMNLNEEKTLTFKPEEAFGERIEDLVRVMPISEFRKHDIDPYPGLRVNIDNASAIVKSVNSGRVIVDANHPYAGKEVKYQVKIVKNLTSESDKIAALGRTYDLKITGSEIKEKNLVIRFDSNVMKNADYFVGKANLIASIFSYFKNIEKVMVEEEYTKPKESEKKDEERSN